MDTAVQASDCQRCCSNFTETKSVTGSLNLATGPFEQKCGISTLAIFNHWFSESTTVSLQTG